MWTSYPPTQSVCLVGGCVDTASEDYLGESPCVQNNFHKKRLQHLYKKEKDLDLKLNWPLWLGWGGESVIWDWTFLWTEIAHCSWTGEIAHCCWTGGGATTCDTERAKYHFWYNLEHFTFEILLKIILISTYNWIGMSTITSSSCKKLKTHQKHFLLRPLLSLALSCSNLPCSHPDKVPQNEEQCSVQWYDRIRGDGYDGSIQCSQVSALCADCTSTYTYTYLHLPSWPYISMHLTWQCGVVVDVNIVAPPCTNTNTETISDVTIPILIQTPKNLVWLANEGLTVWLLGMWYLISLHDGIEDIPRAS